MENDSSGPQGLDPGSAASASPGPWELVRMQILSPHPSSPEEREPLGVGQGRLYFHKPSGRFGGSSRLRTTDLEAERVQAIVCESHCSTRHPVPSWAGIGTGPHPLRSTIPFAMDTPAVSCRFSYLDLRAPATHNLTSVFQARNLRLQGLLPVT